MPAIATKRFASNVARLATTTVESQLRIVDYNIRFTRARRQDPAAQKAAWQKAQVRKSALFLEMVLVAVCANEALAETGAETFEAVGKDPASFTKRVKELSGLEPAEVIKQVVAAGLFKNLPPPPARMPPLSETVRAARTVIESCPIAILESLANTHRLEGWGHRCRVAYDALRAFIFRHDPDEQDRLSIIGREYQHGALSLNDVAALLKSDPTDAVVILEEHGYIRPVETILLGDDARLALYARIKRDRESRAGKFEPTPEQITREVVASERIEGVDARRWIRPEVG